MDTSPIMKGNQYSGDVRCCNCNAAPLSIEDTWEVLGVSPVCGSCAKKCAKPEHVFRCVPCEECGCPTANTIFDARGLFVCGSCHDRQRQHSPAQSPGASHAPASATASASPAGAAAGDDRWDWYYDRVPCNPIVYPAASPSPLAPNPSPLVWYHRPLLTAGLPIGVASLLLIAAAVDRVVDSGAPWHDVGEILSAMAPVLATFSIILALGIGWMLRGFSNDLRDTAKGGPDADSQPTARND